MPSWSAGPKDIRTRFGEFNKLVGRWEHTQRDYVCPTDLKRQWEAWKEFTKAFIEIEKWKNSVRYLYYT